MSSSPSGADPLAFGGRPASGSSVRGWVAETCTVTSVEAGDEAPWDLDFACASATYTLNLSIPVPPGLQPGDNVELSLFIDSPFWGNGYVKVIRDGQLGPEPVIVPEVGRSFIVEEPCTQDRRLGLAFDLGDDSTTVLDRTGGELGPLEIYVGRTVSHVDTFCADTPDGWREFVAVRL